MTRDSWIVFCASVAVFTLLGSYGFYLTDEMELGAAAHNVHEWRLTVDEVPDEYYTYFMKFNARVRFIDGHGYIAESRTMPVLSLAAYPALLGAELAGTAQFAFIALATAGLGGAAFLAHAPRARTLPVRRLWWERAAIGAPVLAFLALNVLYSRDVGFPVWGPAFGMQFVSILITASGVAAAFLLVRAWTSDRGAAALTSVLLLFGSTLPFWAFGQKYHGVQIAAFAWAAYLRFAPNHNLLRHASAYAVAGLAVWSHAKVGGFLLVALMIVDAVRVIRMGVFTSHAGRTVVACGLALVIGLVPFAVENHALYGTPMYPGYLGVGKLAEDAAKAPATPPPAPADGGSDDGAPPASEPSDDAEPEKRPSRPPPDVKKDVERTAKKVKSTFTALGFLKDPFGTPQALYHAFVAPPLGEHDVEYGFLAVMPLLALAPLGLWMRRRELSELDLFLCAHAAIIVAAYAFYALDHGPGLESRYYSPLIPALAIYSAVLLARTVGPHLKRVLAGAAAGTAVMTLLWMGAVIGLPKDYVVHVYFLRDIGAVALALVLLWFAAARPFLAKRADRRALLPFADAPVLALGFSVTAWYFVQHCIVYPPRSAWAGQPDGTLYMFIPLVDVVRQTLGAAVGA